MPGVIRGSLLLAVAATLSGCASSPSAIESTTLEGKRIGVVSVAGHELTRTSVGLTVFGNETEKRDIASWQLDAAFAQGLSDALAAKGHTVAPYPDASLLRIYDPKEALLSSGPNWEALAEPVRSYCAANKVDAVAVLFAVELSGPFNSNQVVRGAGTYSRGGWQVVHLLADVALVDCASAQPIASRRLAAKGGLITSMVHEVGYDLASAPLATLSDQQVQTIKDVLTKMASDAMPYTIDQLLGAKPPKPPKAERKKVIQR